MPGSAGAGGAPGEDAVAGVAEDSARERGSGVRVDQAVRGRDEGVRLRRRGTVE